MGSEITRTEETEAIYDPVLGDDGESITARIVRCVATTLDRDPTGLPPMFYAINTNALDKLYPPIGNGNANVWFRYAGVEVHVRNEGSIWIVAPESLLD
ncbi:HalOD1 output domain-containing protein [Natrinema marinum]|uniref:HalOD1 output domain-containing protein n=1 Tax=Natrinema marinum TaxID=2961598 RepID=UPI0020C8E48C|nr:HalOD1 output domain-containing protein [Natrinema marinum]